MNKVLILKEILKNKIIRQKLNNKNLYNNYLNLFTSNFLLLPVFSLNSIIIHNLRFELKKYSYKILKLKLSFLKNKILYGDYLLIYNLKKNLELDFFYKNLYYLNINFIVVFIYNKFFYL